MTDKDLARSLIPPAARQLRIYHGVTERILADQPTETNSYAGPYFSSPSHAWTDR